MSKYVFSDNPFEGDKAAVAAGRELFVTNCLRCHGAEGFGDGPAEGVPLDQRIADLTDIGSEKSVGTIAGRIAVGKGEDMPAFEKVLTEEQIWLLANYIRSVATVPFEGRASGS